MKKQEREIYITLAGEIDWILCSFCRYSRFEGSVCYDEVTLECEHPLEAVTDMWDWDNPSPMEDCWGFCPNLKVSDLADIVGLVLANNWDWEKVSWWKDDGKIMVSGRAREKVHV